MFFTVEDTFQYIDYIPEGNLLEFGVYNGNTLARLVQRKNFVEVWGFDSFEGLPDNHEGNPDWPVGAFNSVRDGGFNNAEEIKAYITERVGRSDIKLIEGFFHKTLTPAIGHQLHNTASYIHLDCDLYTSTAEVLSWLFKYGVPKEGCLFRYDDWYGYSNIGGQKAAHERYSLKYRIGFQQVADNVFIYEGQR